MDSIQSFGKGNWEPVIGLEVHVHLATKTKLFCGCELAYSASPNSYTCPVCQGLPGVLPVPNEQAIEFALKMGVAVEGNINLKSRFARKHYFYPDLPKGYQISQFEEPIIHGGQVPIWWEGHLMNIPLTRIHLEEDAGKIVHAPDTNTSLIDLNRCGSPLIEIVTDPAISYPKQAALYLERIRQTVRYLKISEGNMEKGQLRCDANISLRPRGLTQLGTKTEIKNLNSIRSVEKALHYEIKRQSKVLEKGESVVQGTYLWDEKTEKSELMRTKEEAQDYRYMPDPDLPVININPLTLGKYTSALPELPHIKEQRWKKDYHLKEEEIQILSRDEAIADYFDACIQEGVTGKLASNWIRGELLALINEFNLTIDELKINPKRIAGLIKAVEEGIINRLMAKEVLHKMQSDERSAEEIIQAEGLVQDSNMDSLLSQVKAVLDQFPGEVERYKNGKKGLLGFFVGQVMKETKGKSNPEVLKEILEEKLG